MARVNLGDSGYTLDDRGFLDPPEQWDENFAEAMARSLGVVGGLTERHWRVIRYLRTKFLEEKTVPVVVIACSQLGLRLAELRALFPTGYHRGACRVAGINYRFMYETNYWLTYETGPPVADRYDVDSCGFLKDYRTWDEDFADLVATDLGVTDGVSDRHRAILHYLRNSYESTGVIPTVYDACSNNDLTLDELAKLFPEGYRRGACRMAGLPFIA
jgi:tRNA 2-thiouridine synthesizing protein E